MKKFLFWRLVQFPLTLAVIYLVTFMLVWVIPGSPLEGEKKIEDAKLQQKLEQFHADRWQSFLTYYPWRIITRLDFGPSLRNQEATVQEIIARRLPASAAVGFIALAIAVAVGTVIGTLSAVRRDGIVDWAGVSVTLIGISVPSFVVASLLLIVFVADLRWFGLGGYTLPAIALSLGPLAYIVRLQRVSMLDTLGADYVRTARAKGLSKPRVVIGHCLRNAFLPVFTYLGPAAATTLTGSFVVEQVFRVKGIGDQFISAVLNRDQTMILGLVVVYSVILLAFNLIVDIGYAFIDPRIDVSARK